MLEAMHRGDAWRVLRRPSGRRPWSAAAPSALVGALLALPLGAPAVASAQGAFGPPADLTPARAEAFAPRVAVGDEGHAVAVWRAVTPGGSAVRAAARGPDAHAGPAAGTGTRWSAPVELTAPGADALGPEVAMSPAGDAVAVWRRAAGGASLVEASVRPASGAWSAPVVLSAPTTDAVDPQVAVVDGGRAAVVWNAVAGGRSVVQATSLVRGGLWSAPVGLSDARLDAVAAQVALDAAGGAVAVWTAQAAGRLRVQAASHAPGLAWSPPADLSPLDADARDPQVAVGPRGEAVAVWSGVVGEGSVLAAATRATDGPWSAPVAVTAPRSGIDVVLPQVAVGPDGEAVAAWVRSAERDASPVPGSVVQVAARAPDGAWGAAGALTGPGAASAVRLALGPGGDAVAVWRSIGPRGVSAVESAHRPSAGGWSRPAHLAPSAPGAAAERPDVAVGGAGEAVAVWETSTARDSVVQAAVAAVPVVRLLESHAAAGAPAPSAPVPRTLAAGAPYRVTLVGAVSLWEPALMAVRPPAGWLVCGTPEAAPRFPSPARPEALTGADAEFVFARPLPATACPADGPRALPLRRPLVRLSLDGGASWSTPTPEGGPPTAPAARHVYRYAVVGRGHPLVVALTDELAADNTGRLRVEVRRLPR